MGVGTETTTATGQRGINEWESEFPCTSRYFSSLVNKQLSNLSLASVLNVVDDTIGEFTEVSSPPDPTGSFLENTPSILQVLDNSVPIVSWCIC